MIKLRLSYLHKGHFYTDMTRSLYWISCCRTLSFWTHLKGWPGPAKIIPSWILAKERGWNISFWLRHYLARSERDNTLKSRPCSLVWSSGIILGMGSANERWHYIVRSSLIGWAHTQNDTWGYNLHTQLYALLDNYATTPDTCFNSLGDDIWCNRTRSTLV